MRSCSRPRFRSIEVEGLESRTLLAIIPAATGTNAPMDLSGIGTGNANSPAVTIDPYDPTKVIAVWTVDTSATAATVDGAYSSNGGTSWTTIGTAVDPAVHDPLAASATTNYTLVTDPTVAFDSRGNVYVLALQSTSPTDGALVLVEYNFSGPAPAAVALPNNGIVDQWVTGSDAATSPALAVDRGTYPNSSPSGTPPAGVQDDNFANNVYIAWASIDVTPATAPTSFNPDRAELVVGTPVPAPPLPNETTLAFSGVTTLNAGGDAGGQQDAHPQLVISPGNSTDPGQVTIAWEDISGTTSLMSNTAQPGDAYGFVGNGGAIAPATSASSGGTTPKTTTFADSVQVPNPSAIDDLTVTLALTDPQGVQGLSVILMAPNNAGEITLVNSQLNAAGTITTSLGLPSGNAIGVVGFSNTTAGNVVGTVFDDNADRDIFDRNTGGTNGNAAAGASGYAGYFQPEGGSLKSLLARIGPNNINGTWQLVVTDFSSATPAGDTVDRFNLTFSTGMVPSMAGNITAPDVVPGSLTDTYPTIVPASPNVGVGPGLVLAIDNTLGPNSPDSGRIYAAYVGYQANVDRPTNNINPKTNTDIYLSYFNPKTGSWVAQGIVNDDNAATDGFSGAGSDFSSGGDTTGRTQFQPAIAVDQATGTLVISWRDARNDAANARVATYITTSIDGGNTFSAQTYANPNITATDAITGQQDVLGPQADNESAGNPSTDTTFGYGEQMGLAVFGGHVDPVWAGNFNAGLDSKGTVKGAPLNIWYRPMVIAAGPRITASSMGPISLAQAQTGVVNIIVTFDRPIILGTFVAGDVSVYYHDTNKGDPFIPLKVLGVVADSSSQFTVSFDSTPPGANPATFNYTGTYSYLIAPDAGAGTMPISSPIWSYAGGTLWKFDPMDQNADGTPDENVLVSSFTGQTPGDVYSAPAPQLPPGAELTSFSGPMSILEPTFGFNSTTFPLIIPGPQVLSASVPGGDSVNGNLVTDGTTSTMNVTFDRPILINTAPAGQMPTAGSFTGADVLSIMGPSGEIDGPQFFPADVQTGLVLGGSGTVSATLTIPSFGGTFTIADITVSLSAAFTPDADLSAVLVAPNGTMVPLFSGVGSGGSNFINTVLDDNAENPISSGTAPFTGSFRPTGKLSSLDGQPVDFKNSFGLWVPGVWTLELTTAGGSGMLDSWSLSITPQITVTPIPASENQNKTAATQFQIGFPLQQLSGTYTVQLGPNILDTFGDALDTNQNAGLAVLRDTGQNSPTSTVQYTSGDLPKPIPAPAAGADATVSSTITVPDNFLIQGDTTTEQVSGLRVQINIGYPNDPDLSATLFHFDSSGNRLGSAKLFANVGGLFNDANFTDTVFDDNATTPIQEGAAPFFATFNPQESLSTAFAGTSAQGTWTLVIQNAATGSGDVGTFGGWSLSFQKPLPTTGLGEPGSDDFTGSFRIFTLSQVDALSSQQWTAVGPAAIGSGGTVIGSDPSGRVTGLAIDPSDPSGNTVFAAGASGGIWKTTDFLDTGAGPTWIPLTDFGPTSGVNIGGIAVFPRNNDPNQSIVIAATGEGDTGTPGVGFLVSENGGETWVLNDSTVNVDSSGDELPIASASRDRKFVGDSAFQVVVDPTLTPSGGVIIYAALSGPTGGIWRSEDTGATWQLMKSGQATSVVLAPGSGAVLSPTTGANVQGNLQVVYAAFRGSGVFISPDQGAAWNQMTGDIGNPLIFDSFNPPPDPNVNPTNGPTPNGAEGRIELAVPTATGNAAFDAVYEGWLYAIVATPGGTLDGIFVTKDFGQNWTQFRIPTEPNQGYQSNPAIPDNDVGLADYPVIGSTQFPQGNYNIAIAIDPTDPSVIYVGGTEDGNETGLIRINLTDIWDAHSLVPYSYNSNDGGKLTLASTGPAALFTFNVMNTQVTPNVSYLNFIRNPEDPFVGNASLFVFDYSSFTNSGAGVEWIPFDVNGTDYHRIATMIDPLTGLPRLIFGNDQGIWSVLDNNGAFQGEIGFSNLLPGINRNGNLQITQFYYGAAQPSNAAALIAHSLFYGSAQDNGGPSSDPSVINNGDIVWNGPGGDAAGVATNQQGNGTLYQYWWPCCGGADTNFFQVNGAGRTDGLLQASGGQPTPDPQWPFTGGANFAVNPVNGQDIVISSAAGRIFTTSNEGVTWFDVGDPSVFNNPGTFSVALAYGAPDPNAPSGVGNLGNFIYVGTVKGQIFVTQDGGGGGGSNNWLNISLGLDGSPVESIIADPTRGSHDAYAVTTTGVFYLPDSILLGNNPSTAALGWVNITSNLKQLAYSIFGQNYDPTRDPNAKTYFQAASLSAIAADWRYAIPDTKKYSSGPTDHPVLYVSAGTSSGVGSGVFQSLDGGQTWTYFPDTSYGAVVEGGNLPHVAVTSLSLSIGNVDPNTGMPTLDGPYAPNAGNQKPESSADPDVLMAATYGQGEFAINLAPLIVGNTVTVTPTSPPIGNSGPPIVGGPITISGTSEISAFGDATWITVEDITNPAAPRIIAGFNPGAGVPTPSASNSANAQGSFSIALNPLTAFATTGIKTIEIFATDNAGSVGNKVTYTFNDDPATQLAFDSSGEPPATALTGSNFASSAPILVDALDPSGKLDPAFNGTVTLALLNNTSTALSGTLTATAVNGVATFSNLAINTDGTYRFEAMSPGLTTGDSTSITVVGAAAKLYIVQEPPGSVQAGAQFGLEVAADDAAGNPTPFFPGGVTVKLLNNPGNSTLGGTTTEPAGTSGIATFSDLTLNIVGTGYTLQATSPMVASVTTSPIAVKPAPAVQLTIPTSGEPPADVDAGDAFSMVVDAVDKFGNLDTNYGGSVTISLPSNVTGTTSVNARNGVATFSNLVIDQVGTYQLQAGGTAVSSATSSSVTVAPNPKVGILAWALEPPTQVSHGASFDAKLMVEDQFQNLETSFAGTVQMMLDNNPGHATLGGGAATATGGMVDFPALTLDAVASGYTLQATVAGVSSPASTPIDVIGIPPVALNVSTQPPSSTQVFQPFRLTVDVTDQAGNPDPDFDGSVTVAIANGPSGSALGGGSTTVAASGGIATFSGLTLNKVGSVALQLSVSGLGTVQTNSINVTAAAAAKLVIVSEPPTSVTAGATFGVEVEAQDQYGNLATSFSGSVTAALLPTSSGATLGGTITAVASAGMALLNGLSVDQAGTGYAIRIGATDNSLTTATTTPFQVTAAAAAHVVIATQPPSSLTAGVPFGLTITIEDQFNNLVTTFSGTVTIAMSNNPGTGTLDGLLTVPATGGQAAFSPLYLDTAGSGYTIVAGSTGLTAATTGAINVTPAAASKLILSIPVPSTLVAGSGFGLAVEAFDPFGNLATSFDGTVTLTLVNNPAHATLNGPLTVATNGGIANSHDFYTIDTAASGYTILAATPGLPSVTTGSIMVTPAAATKLVVKTQPPSSVAAGGEFGLVVDAEDEFNNVDTNFGGQVSVALPPGTTDTLGGSVTTNAAAGEALFSSLTLTGTTSSVSLQINSAGLTGTSTTQIGVTSGTQIGTPAVVAFATTSVNVDENAGLATLELVRSGAASEAVSVNVATSGGTAAPGVNYTPINQVVTFAAGQTTQSVAIPVKNAGNLAEAMTVNVVLSGPSANASLGTPFAATLTILNVGQTTALPPPVTVERVQLVKNKKHQITEIVVGFSGAINPAEAAAVGEYSLVLAGKKGRFTGKGAKSIKLKSAVFNPATDTVTLLLKKRLVLTKKAQLTIDGMPPSGIEDTFGRLIDGNHDGQPGGNAVAILTSKGAATSAVTNVAAVVDALLEQGELGRLTKARGR
jgi:subtilisin-like proprotein convertase family protein